MTHYQLNLLINYINTKVALAVHQAKNNSVSRRDVDDLVSILEDLENSIEDSNV